MTGIEYLIPNVVGRRPLPWIGVAVLLGTLLLAIPGAAPAGAEVNPARIEPVRILNYEPFAQRSIIITMSAGYCIGEPKPVWSHVSFRERRESDGSPGGRLVVTAYIERKAPVLPRSSATPLRQSEGPSEPVPVCSGIEYELTKRLGLPSRSNRLTLYDGSASPPRRVRVIERGALNKDRTARYEDEQGGD